MAFSAHLGQRFGVSSLRSISGQHRLQEVWPSSVLLGLKIQRVNNQEKSGKLSPHLSLSFLWLPWNPRPWLPCCVICLAVTVSAFGKLQLWLETGDTAISVPNLAVEGQRQGRVHPRGGWGLASRLCSLLVVNFPPSLLGEWPCFVLQVSRGLARAVQPTFLVISLFFFFDDSLTPTTSPPAWCGWSSCSNNWKTSEVKHSLF